MYYNHAYHMEYLKCDRKGISQLIATVDRFDCSLKYMMSLQICVTRIIIHFNRSMSN